MKKTDWKDCKAVVLQAVEAVQEADDEKFSRILFPVPADEWFEQTGETELPKASHMREVLEEVQDYGFALPYEVESLVKTEDYEGKSWFDASGFPELTAVDAAVYWSASAGRNVCYGWPVPFQCIYIEDRWYLNPYWVWEYLR